MIFRKLNDKIMTEEEISEYNEMKYREWLSKKPFFNLDCYYCIYENSCEDAHTWKTGERECNNFRGA